MIDRFVELLENEVKNHSIYVWVAMAKPIFDWGKDDFNFNVPVHIEGDLSLTGDIEIGGVSLKTLLGLGR